MLSTRHFQVGQRTLKFKIEYNVSGGIMKMKSALAEGLGKFMIFGRGYLSENFKEFFIVSMAVKYHCKIVEAILPEGKCKSLGQFGGGSVYFSPDEKLIIFGDYSGEYGEAYHGTVRAILRRDFPGFTIRRCPFISI